MFPASRALSRANPARLYALAPSQTLSFHTTSWRQNSSKKHGRETNAATAAGGSYARTDNSITVEYPSDGSLPPSQPVSGAGRAGANVFPTLASFSLQGKVGVVTGGARGLGLVMGQGMVISGADLAIVDLNSMSS